MSSLAISTWTQIEAERAFKRAARARRRATLVARLRRRGRRFCGLAVYDEAHGSATRARRGLHVVGQPIDRASPLGALWRVDAASAGALAVGRLAPELLDVAPWPYVLLGCGYASLAVGLLLVGAQRQRELEHALRTGGHVPLRFRTVGLFTAGGVALALLTVVLVISQT